MTSTRLTCPSPQMTASARPDVADVVAVSCTPPPTELLSSPAMSGDERVQIYVPSPQSTPYSTISKHAADSHKSITFLSYQPDSLVSAASSHSQHEEVKAESTLGSGSCHEEARVESLDSRLTSALEARGEEGLVVGDSYPVLAGAAAGKVEQLGAQVCALFSPLV